MYFRTATVKQSFDLNNVCRGDGQLFVRDGVGHAGRGEFLCLNEHDARATLTLSRRSQFQPSDTDEFTPIAFGLVPFLPTQESRFTIPHTVLSKYENGDQVITVVSHEDTLTDDYITKALKEALSQEQPKVTASSFTVAPVMPIDQYLDTVALGRDSVAKGEIAKVVIARDIAVTSDSEFNVHGILMRLRASFGSSYRYCINNMIGASPELLVEVSGRSIRSHPLAGTAPRTGDPVTDKKLAQELIASTKNQIEHRVVIDMVHDTLLPYCSYLDWEPEPSIVTVANVQHLGTSIEGALTEPTAHVFDLVKLLSPTPALGGSPSQAAIEFIIHNEHMERGFYGGAVGFMNARGDGTFAVTIRCAELSPDKHSARLFAGGGIVAESEPLSELAETQAKFQAMLSAIVRP